MATRHVTTGRRPALLLAVLGGAVAAALMISGAVGATAATPPPTIKQAVLRLCTTPTSAMTNTARSNGYAPNNAYGGVCQTAAASLPAGAIKPWCWVKDAWWKGASTDKWFYVSRGEIEGYALGSDIDHEGSVPPCSGVPWIRAASWAIKHNGQTDIATVTERYGNPERYWNGMCWLFAFDAWRLGADRVPSPTGDTAAAAMNAFSRAGKLDTGGRVPPRGSIVFWGSGPISRSGHAAVSLGDGWVMTTAGPGPGTLRGPAVQLKRLSSYAQRPGGFVDRSRL